ncbi:hypothetical protein, partial [uncultured Ruminococcus sp.]|uniref:hypothetical protein n=1 Tax=uncultured Ruminococcus sp. TaxID=165186 RepID=UPI0025EF6745
GSLGDFFILSYQRSFVNTSKAIKPVKVPSEFLYTFSKNKKTHPASRRMRFCIPYSIPQGNTAQSQPVGLAHPPHILCAVLP